MFVCFKYCIFTVPTHTHTISCDYIVIIYHISSFIIYLFSFISYHFDIKSWLHTELLKLRSKDYGSPNCRKRVYIVGVRKDMLREIDFKSMVNFIELKCTAVHQRCTLRCCVLASRFGLTCTLTLGMLGSDGLCVCCSCFLCP